MTSDSQPGPQAWLAMPKSRLARWLVGVGGGDPVFVHLLQGASDDPLLGLYVNAFGPTGAARYVPLDTP